MTMMMMPVLGGGFPSATFTHNNTTNKPTGNRLSVIETISWRQHKQADRLRYRLLTTNTFLSPL